MKILRVTCESRCFHDNEKIDELTQWVYCLYLFNDDDVTGTATVDNTNHF